jgi:hypothetical protein
VTKIAAVLLLVAMTLSGGLDVFRTATRQINITVFDQDAVEIAREIRTRTAPDSIVLSAPTYNTAVVLSGRTSVMRYGGHLASHGIDYGPREADIRSIYSGGPAVDSLLAKYDVDIVLFGPEVRFFSEDQYRRFPLNEEYFKKYPLLAATPQFRVYKIK